MTSESQFRAISYLAVFCGFFALWISGSFRIVETAVFIGILLFAWKLEDSRWQISERIGTSLIVLSLPIYYLLWRYPFFDFSNSEMVLPGILARLILSLSSIKMLQNKSDRDWMFLYVMSFFQVLLAAGLSISIGYVIAFAAFIFLMACTIILFQIRKTSRWILESSTVEKERVVDQAEDGLPLRRAVWASAVLIVITAAVAVPTFFLLPRVSGAGFGGASETVSTIAGFSDSVRLGGIGRIQQNDAVVMRVRIDKDAPDKIHWRGVALDTFDGQYWSRSRTALREPKTKNELDLIQVDSASRQDGLTLQTVYLEPLDTSVIFGLYRMIGIQGNFNVLYRDALGAITFQRTGERVSYKVLSDTAEPSPSRLREDHSNYGPNEASNLQLPDNLDPRIAQLAESVVKNSTNRYDSAAAIERYLQNEFGYTLEQKAGGSDPLADFLFNVREGHCEYFATAMAIMLRTQGIAARIVNGFQRGEYNDAADVYVVRQRNAHSWVEVYFPKTESWVTFDPTPAAGQNNIGGDAGISASLRKYVEALETFWIQYFVAFDNQEQRSLLVSVKNGIGRYETGISTAWNRFQTEIVEWWKRVRGDKGIEESLLALGRSTLFLAVLFALAVVFVWFYRKIVKLKVWRELWDRLFARSTRTSIEFYDRMLRILASKGYLRTPFQTPLEFAMAVGIDEVVKITEEYNRVRFGGHGLSKVKSDEIEKVLGEMGSQ